MKKNQLIAVLLSAATLFSCSATDSPEQQNKTKTVKVNVLTRALTRSGDKTSVTPGYKTPVNDAVVFFLDGNDEVCDAQRTMSAADVLAGGITYTGVNPATTKVYVVANTTHSGGQLFSAMASIGVGSPKSAIENLSASVSTQKDDSAMGVDNVTMSGEAALITVNATDYEAAVTVTPSLCRFEIHAITGAGVSPSNITAFDLEGIYLNTYYPQFTVGGGAAGTFFGISADGANLSTVISEMKDSGLDMVGSLTYKPADSKIWSYMVPVYTTSPRIILKLQNIVVNSGSTTVGPNYITVQNFVNSATNEILTLKRGEVYVIKDIKFTPTDLTDNPNQDKLNVTVIVDVRGWNVVEVGPILN